MSWVIYILVVLGLGAFLSWKRLFIKVDIQPLALFTLLTIKILAGFTLFWIYTDYYPDRSLADIFKYYDDGRVLYQVFWESKSDFFEILFGQQNRIEHGKYLREMNTWYTLGFGSDYLLNDTRTIIKLSAILQFISFGNYHLTAFYFLVIGFFGQLQFYKGLRNLFDKIPAFPILVSVFLLPSVLIWNSGVLKEVVLISGLGLFIRFLGELRQGKKVWKFLLASIFILSFVKYYILLCLIPASIIYWMPDRLMVKRQLAYSLIILMILSVIALNIHHVLPNYDLILMLMKKHDDFYRLAEFMNSGSISYIGQYPPELIPFLTKIPLAIGNVWFQPFIHLLFQSPSFTLIPAILENTFYVLFPLLLLKFRKTSVVVNHKAMFFCIVFTIGLYLLIGLTTPVIGAIVRYKVPALTLYLVAIFSLIDWEKLRVPTFLSKIFD